MVLLLCVLVFFGLAYLFTWCVCGKDFLEGKHAAEEYEPAAATEAEATPSYSPALGALRAVPPLPFPRVPLAPDASLTPEKLVWELEQAIGDETAAISQILHKQAKVDLQQLYHN